MTDRIECWLVDPATGENLVLIEERSRCPVDRVELDDEGFCPVDGLNWEVWD
jgi:hypothetical protein